MDNILAEFNAISDKITSMRRRYNFKKAGYLIKSPTINVFKKRVFWFIYLSGDSEETLEDMLGEYQNLLVDFGKKFDFEIEISAG